MINSIKKQEVYMNKKSQFVWITFAHNWELTYENNQQTNV